MDTRLAQHRAPHFKTFRPIVITAHHKERHLVLHGQTSNYGVPQFDSFNGWHRSIKNIPCKQYAINLFIFQNIKELMFQHMSLVLC